MHVVKCIVIFFPKNDFIMIAAQKTGVPNITMIRKKDNIQAL